MNETLATLIKDAREKKELSQRELSRQTGIDNNTISQIEKGERRKPNSLSLLKLSQVLDLPLNTLMVAAGYTESDIDMALKAETTSSFFGRKIMDASEMLQDVNDKIIKIKELIKSIKDSKEKHDDPAYKVMTKEDINFFDEQSDELIKMNEEMLKIYEKRAVQLQHIVNVTTGYSLKKAGIDVIDINGEKID